MLNNSLPLNLSKKPRTIIQKFLMFKQFQDFDQQSVKFGLTTMLANRVLQLIGFSSLLRFSNVKLFLIPTLVKISFKI